MGRQKRKCYKFSTHEILAILKKVKEKLQHQELTAGEPNLQYSGVLLQHPRPVSYILFSTSFFPSVFECGIAAANLLRESGL